MNYKILLYTQPKKKNKIVEKLYLNIGWFVNPSKEFTPEELFIGVNLLKKGFIYKLKKITNGMAFYAIEL